MKCPIDETHLIMSERQGIEIDYCPECRGVWLDRGELDKIIERSERSSTQPPLEIPKARYDNHNNKTPSNKNRESWLSELFD